MPVTPQRFTEVWAVTAVARANRDVVIAAEESGQISAILVEKGARVSAGQPLLRIDDALLRTQVQHAQAVADFAQETHARRKRLWEEDKVGSELAYLQARYEAAQAAANLANLQERLARTVVRAPITGMLEDRRVEIGTTVAPGTLLLRIVDVSRVKIAGGVPERFAQDVSVGREVEISFAALGGETVRGRASFVGSAVDQQNRTFPIEIVVANPDGRIKPEMVANVRLPLREASAALVVPQQALVRAEGGFIAYVVVERAGKTVAEQRSVAVGALSGNDVVVLDGIKAGERLIVVGQQKVADGDAVVIIGEREGARP
jgi:RND family efflux transporter MFP subunit